MILRFQDTRPTRDQALDMVACARRMVELHKDFFWAAHLSEMADMVEKLVDYAEGELK